MKISGAARSILTAERTALNFMQRLSGIATQTHEYVKAVDGTQARILDTRKTTPGWRALEKAAVVSGGGTNHRMGLYDRVMVKDNHLVSEGGMEELHQSIQRLLADHPDVEVELEADRLEQVRAFLTMEEVDYILLDNMSLDELRQAVEMRGMRTRPMLEASGGVTLQTVRAIAKTGVDFISVGALTHSVQAMDLALDFVAS
jgi:nicotinate-nucleotide pyrophosphorylase (carboxylating)